MHGAVHMMQRSHAGAAEAARPAKRRRTETAVPPPRRAVVLDIEGTLTSIAFVKQTLFPYARQHLEKFLSGHQQSPEVVACIRELHQLVRPSGSHCLCH